MKNTKKPQKTYKHPTSENLRTYKQELKLRKSSCIKTKKEEPLGKEESKGILNGATSEEACQRKWYNKGTMANKC